MKLGVCAQVFYDRPLGEALGAARALGFSAIELPVHLGNPFVDLDVDLRDGGETLGGRVRSAGLEVSALSAHQEGQLLLGPYGDDTAHVHPGTPDERAAFAANRLVDTAALANRMGVRTVCAFVGCPAWSRTFPWPYEAGWARDELRFREALLPVLDAFGALGVSLALECHPNQLVYDLETAVRAVALVDGHEAMRFNLDPANLAYAEVDPCAFVEALGDRIAHVHAKDAERPLTARGRSGALAQGAWDRPGRGFRFRVPGWGDLDWRRIVTSLHCAGYDGVLSVEHEDPTMSRREGLVQAVRHLEPLLLHEAREARWW
jgi:sugar phosphate isomerase/epimerase